MQQEQIADGNILPSGVDRSVLRKVKLTEQGTDFTFWQSQPPEARLSALEEIRTEYNSWKYGAQQGFQRVYTIIKRT